MDDLNIEVGALDRKTGSVPVTFTLGEAVHKRRVNAVLRADGSHDRAATIERAADVGRGVVEKMRLGLFDAPATPADPE